MRLYSTSGRPVTLGEVLSESGGEGVVHRVASQPGQVAKIYRPGQADAARRAKLAHMIANPPEDRSARRAAPSVAWPVDVLFSDPRGSALAGYVMPEVRGALLAVALYDVAERKRLARCFNWRHLLHTTRNLADVIDVLHRRGYVIGDLNESNVFVHADTTVTLIDTDSFQMVVGGRCLPCTVGKPEYTPPESQAVTFRDHARTRHDDTFAYGVLAFQLLMLGRHPFDSIPQRADLDSPESPGRIRSNWFAAAHLGQGKGILPPSKCPPFRLLPPTVQSLFVRCFVDGARNPALRPAASEWRHTLSAVIRNGLAVCRSNPEHIFPNHLTACPWCERITRERVQDPFPNPMALQHARGRLLRTPAMPAQRQTTPARVRLWFAQFVVPRWRSLCNQLRVP